MKSFSHDPSDIIQAILEAAKYGILLILSVSILFTAAKLCLKLFKRIKSL